MNITLWLRTLLVVKAQFCLQSAWLKTSWIQFIPLPHVLNSSINSVQSSISFRHLTIRFKRAYPQFHSSGLHEEVRILSSERNLHLFFQGMNKWPSCYYQLQTIFLLPVVGMGLDLCHFPEDGIHVAEYGDWSLRCVLLWPTAPNDKNGHADMHDAYTGYFYKK